MLNQDQDQKINNQELFITKILNSKVGEKTSGFVSNKYLTFTNDLEQAKVYSKKGKAMQIGRYFFVEVYQLDFDINGNRVLGSLISSNNREHSLDCICTQHRLEQPSYSNKAINFNNNQSNRNNKSSHPKMSLRLALLPVTPKKSRNKTNHDSY